MSEGGAPPVIPRRRDFIRESLSLVFAAPCAAIVAGCASLLTRTVTPENGALRLALAQYPELQRDGSLKVLPAGSTEPIYVLAAGENQFAAISSTCTHLQCTVDLERAGRGARFVCPCHGSQYDNDGRVLKGPAEAPLRRFRTELNAGVLIVHLTGERPA